MNTEELDRLVRKGRAEPTRGIIDQTEYTIGLAMEKKADLLATGMTEEMLADMVNKRDGLLQYISVRGASMIAAEDATREEERWIGKAKTHLRNLRLATPMAIRTTPLTETELKKLVPATPVGRSTIRLMDHFTNCRDSVAKLDGALKPFFRGESALGRHDTIRSGLLSAQRNQETKSTATPEDTKELHLIKGQLLQLIEDINRIGQLAYPDEAEKSARFNKDILLRARRGGGRKGSKADDSTDGDEGTN